MEQKQIEAKVTTIFAKYIKKDFSVRDDFFALGGHSLQATQVVLDIEKAFKIKISDAEVKNLRTVADISAFVARKLG